MNFGMVILSMVGIFATILYYLMGIYLGDKNDSAFSDAALKKLTIKQDSILRKIIPYKKKGYICTTYLYIRIIPFIIHVLLFVVLMIMLAVDQLLIDFINDNVYVYIATVIGIIFILYNFILAVLAKIL